MKRLMASVIVVVAFTFYAIFSRGNSTVQATANAGTDTTGATTGPVTTQPAVTGEYDDDEMVATQQQTVTTAAPSSAASGYTDGTYTGSRADALYGTVQVQAVVQGGRIADVQFLSHPSGRRESEQINAYADPILVQEAIAAQSADVQVVSGATLTSRAFMESLQAALNQA
jgi:uncharacterized protein with FMN-binding domain